MSLRKGNIIISGNSSGSGGTSDYNDLMNKPSINNIVLLGNKTTSDLNISYNDLKNKPTIPTKTSDLTNDSGFITSSYHDTTKQDALISGTNIKTINGTSLLGSGNVGVGVTNVTAGTGLSGGSITSTGTISLNAAASSTLGGLKVRLDGTTLYIRNDGSDA